MTFRCSGRCAIDVFVMTVSGIILIITVWQFAVIPKGFLPAEDRSQIFVSTEAAQESRSSP